MREDDKQRGDRTKIHSDFWADKICLFQVQLFSVIISKNIITITLKISQVTA